MSLQKGQQIFARIVAAVRSSVNLMSRMVESSVVVQASRLPQCSRDGGTTITTDWETTIRIPGSCVVPDA
jgi:hypothetical protein